VHEKKNGMREGVDVKKARCVISQNHIMYCIGIETRQL